MVFVIVIIIVIAFIVMIMVNDIVMVIILIVVVVGVVVNVTTVDDMDIAIVVSPVRLCDWRSFGLAWGLMAGLQATPVLGVLHGPEAVRPALSGSSSTFRAPNLYFKLKLLNALNAI